MGVGVGWGSMARATERALAAGMRAVRIKAGSGEMDPPRSSVCGGGRGGVFLAIRDAAGLGVRHDASLARCGRPPLRAGCDAEISGVATVPGADARSGPAAGTGVSRGGVSTLA